MRIVFFGSPDFAVSGLRALLEADDMEVLLVISQPDRLRNRNKLSPTPVKAMALDHHIPVLTPEKVNQKEILEKIQEVDPDILVVIAYGQIIGKSLRDAFPDHILNIHGSLLPKYRGAAPIQRALLNGEEKTGVSAMLIRKEMDAGEILAKKEVPIEEDDDLESLSQKMAEAGGQLLLETLRSYDRLLLGKKTQNPDEVTFADKIKKEEGWLDFRQTARALVNQVRTLKDWPGAKFILDGKTYKVHGAHREKEDEGNRKEKPGTVLRADSRGLAVKTGDGLFVIDRIQPTNKKAMDIGAFINGYSIPIGSRLESFTGGEEDHA